MSLQQELIKKLKEIFQIDRAELDFGIYRILNSRSQEIGAYLQSKLPAKIATALRGNTAGEMAVYNHLLTFFSRYYEDGDFISQRRYKGDTYAIPYSGEEVLLHWANKDQYYTKSGENFSNYRFKLSDGNEVFFRLTAADTAKDNRKDNDTARIFTLAEERLIKKEDENGDIYEEAVYPVREVSDASGRKTLEIRFEYAAAPKGDKKPQEKANENTIATLKNLIGEAWQAVWQPAPTEKNPNRTLLEKHLADYTAKNTADYFIHKDLGGFLRRELDFYIKNEVMNLDNIQDAATFAHIESNLRQIQTLRIIAHELIDFLAQLEDFQKKLWLKKKFVAKSHWLITLDNIPKEMLKTVFANAEQREAWKNLFAIKELPSTDENLISFVESNPYLTVDTSLFPASFQTALLAALSNDHDLDEATDGLLIHSDNFQALNLLQMRYREQVKCIYIDPPYNTGSDGFNYKDNYRHSSWLSMLYNRVILSLIFTSPNGISFVSHDDNEYDNLKKIYIDSGYKFKSNLIWNSIGHTDNQFEIKVNHEFISVYYKENPDFGYVIDPNTRKESNLWKNIVENSITKNGVANPFSEITLPIGFPCALAEGKIPQNVPQKDFFISINDSKFFSRNKIKEFNVSFPIRKNDVCIKNGKLTNELVCLSGWANINKLNKFIENKFCPYYDEDGILSFYLSKNGTIYYKKEKDKNRNINSVLQNFSTTEKAKYELENMGLSIGIYLKPKELIQYILKIGTSNKSNLILDYFAGSGTTAHAVINLNREDGGKRKYILVEMAEYFDTVLKPRVQKVVYAENWKDGKPVPSEKTSENNKNPFGGVPQIVKVLKLESYEDTLNNLVLKKQGELYEALPENVREDYLLRYMFDDQSREALLNTDIFKRPFNYQMDIATTSAGATERMNINLVETFNYLLGLRVSGIGGDVEKHGYLTVEGTLPDGEKTIVIWRDCDRLDYGGLNQLLERLKINPRDTEFDVVYINGDHNIPTIWETTDGERSILKIRPIESEFLTLMFEETE